ncbi:MAG: hypothetical protein JWM11_3358 [Planctomycetaceae bacterium]|nr:hypothetical protein [Planctomycetaceae bacterium]
MLQCPNCHDEISKSDIDFSSELASCRHCRSKSHFSEIRGAIRAADFASFECPESVAVTESGARTEIGYFRIPLLAWILVPPLIVLCIAGPWILLQLEFDNQFDMFSLLTRFVATALLRLIVIIPLLLVMISRRVMIILDGNQKAITIRSGLFESRRLDTSNVEAVTIRDSNLKVNNVAKPEICLILKVGAPIVFGRVMQEDSRLYIASLIASKLVV